MSLQRLKVVNKRRGFKIILNSFVKWFSSECSVHQLWFHPRFEASAIKYFNLKCGSNTIVMLTYQTCTIDTTGDTSSQCYSPLSPPHSNRVCQCLVWRKLCRSNMPLLRNADVMPRVHCRCCRRLSGAATIIRNDRLHAIHSSESKYDNFWATQTVTALKLCMKLLLHILGTFSITFFLSDILFVVALAVSLL